MLAGMDRELSVAAGLRVPPFEVVNLGLVPYEDAWALQLRLLGQRDREEIPDTLIVCEHHPVITYGRKSPEQKQGSMPSHIGGVPTFAVERGGEATYHGPGQLVMYPIFRLSARLGPKGFLRLMEEAIVSVLEEYGIAARWTEGQTGVWLENGKKIASLGIAVRQGVSYHGLALNVHTDLAPFHLIQPCGFNANVMTNMRDQIGVAPDLSEVSEKLATAILRAREP